jgi:hypothetical protein
MPCDGGSPAYRDDFPISMRYRAMCRIASLGLRALFIQQRQVVMAVGKIGIAAHRRFVCCDCFRPAVQVFEQHAEIEQQHRIVAANPDRLAVDAFGVGKARGVVEEPSQVDMSIDEGGIDGDGTLIRLQCGFTVRCFQRRALGEIFLRAVRRLDIAVTLDHAQRAVGRITVEAKQILSRLRLPPAASVADDDAVAFGGDAESGQRHRLGQMAAQVAHGFRDAPLRDVRIGERLRGAQHDQILE